MSRIFLSHSSADNAPAIALRDWLIAEGWNDLFVDLDPERGIAAGQRWERRLNEATHRCEAVLFLVSKAWITSEWCRRELNLAHRLNKRIFGVLIEDLPITDVPKDLTRDWQLVRLASGRDHVMLHAVIPITHEEVHVTFSSEGLQRLKYGLQQAGLDPKYFAWPAENDPNRPPYRGLKPLEADDAGIFFGRDAPVIETLDKLRGLRAAALPRLLVILGASGAGKSSFLRAGLLPRLKRDDRNFLLLPIVRPGRAALFGESGLLRALEEAFQVAKIPASRAELRAAVNGGAEKLRSPLKSLVEKATPAELDVKLEAPTLVISIDQGEELFLPEGQDESRTLLTLLCNLATEDSPALIVVFTIRSDSYERLQLAKELEGVHQDTLSLPPMPKGAYGEVIKGPLRRLDETNHALRIDDALVDALLADIEEGGAKDALPLLAFTLERLYLEYGGRGQLTLADYEALGRIKGSIEAAVERAFKAADKDPAIPRDRNARLALLRRGLIPWLAGIDPETGSPRRRVARKSEIPEEARPLIQHLVDERLLATDVAKEAGEQTIEPVHEALLRQWGLLQGWLAEDAGLLGVLQGIERASLEWSANGKNPEWLTHRTNRLRAAEQLLRTRPDLASKFEPTDRAYLAACRKRETTMRTRAAASVIGIALGVGLGVTGWANRDYLLLKLDLQRNVLSEAAERTLKQKQQFQECSLCPVMVVIPAGEFMMGSPELEKGRNKNEDPQHKITFARPFAVSKFVVTYEQWDACLALGGCRARPGDEPWGRGTQPVINVTWDDARQYVGWLSVITGKQYRLLSEAEREYAARAGSTTAYPWGDDIGQNNANCDGCGSHWDKKQTAPVGSFSPNAFGLYDMHGNIWEWAEDCYVDNYDGAPTDGSAIMNGSCIIRVLRGGSWFYAPRYLRSASRGAVSSASRSSGIGFRVARTLASP